MSAGDLMRDLVRFGESETLPNFEAATRALEVHSSTPKSVKIPVPIALNAALGFIRVIERNEDYRLNSLRAWNNLAIMCDRADNSAAFELLTELQSTSILSFVTRAVSSLSEDVLGNEAEYCLKFMCHYARVDGARQILAGQTPGFMETLLVQIDANFKKTSNCGVKMGLLGVLTNLLGRNVETNRTNADLFVAADGFRIVNKVVGIVAHWARVISNMRALDDLECRVVNSCAACMIAAYCVPQKVDFACSPPVLKERTLLDPTALGTTTAALHSFFSLAMSENVQLQAVFVGAFITYGEYIRTMVPASLEATLLFSGSSSVPLVLLFQRTSRDPRLNHLRETVSITLRRFAAKCSAVRSVLDEEMGSHADLASESEYAVNVCAFPGCHNNTINCEAMKKCARCKSVSYCGKEHQEFHWKEHKKACFSV